MPFTHHHPRGPTTMIPFLSLQKRFHCNFSQPRPSLQPLTQHVDGGGGGHSGHSIAGTAFPVPVGLLGQWSQDETAVAVHLGLALQPPAHLQNHW